jgi:hypothetical protein
MWVQLLMRVRLLTQRNPLYYLRIQVLQKLVVMIVDQLPIRRLLLTQRNSLNYLEIQMLQKLGVIAMP